MKDVPELAAGSGGERYECEAVDAFMRLAHYTLANPGDRFNLTADEIRRWTFPLVGHGYPAARVDDWMDDLVAHVEAAR